MSFIDGPDLGAAANIIQRRHWNWLIEAPTQSAPGVLRFYFAELLGIPFSVSGPPVAEKALFLAEIENADTLTFETIALGGYFAGFTYNFSGAMAGHSVTLTGSNLDGEPVSVQNTVDFGRFNTTPAGARYGQFYDFVTMDFPVPISAFGCYGTDWGDFFGVVHAVLTDVNDVETDVIVPNTVPTDNACLIFWGFTHPGFFYKRVRFYCVYDVPPPFGDGDFFGLDDITIGVAA